jgi:hypothetical protein
MLHHTPITFPLYFHPSDRNKYVARHPYNPYMHRNALTLTLNYSLEIFIAVLCVDV